MVDLTRRSVLAALPGLYLSRAAWAAAEAAAVAPWYRRVADSVIARTPDPTGLDPGSQKQTWNYTQGLVLQSVLEVGRRTGEARYVDFVYRYYDQMVQPDGSIRTYRPHLFNIDHVNPGKGLLRLHRLRHEPRFEKALRLLREQLQDHPRTSDGGFWHKQIYPHQMWLDGLYMGASFLAEYARDFDEVPAFDDVTRQFVLMEGHARDERTGLLYHAWDESRGMRWSDPKTGRSPHFWGRAMGWYAMGLVDSWECFPEGHGGRAALSDILKRLAAAVARVQDPATGAFWQVLDQGGRSGNYLEASVTIMFAYALAKGVRLGMLGEAEKPLAARTWEGFLKTFVEVAPDGLVDVNRVCNVAGLGGHPYRDGSYEYYVNERVGPNDPKAVGPFILASLEREA